MKFGGMANRIRQAQKDALTSENKKKPKIEFVAEGKLIVCSECKRFGDLDRGDCIVTCKKHKYLNNLHLVPVENENGKVEYWFK